MELCRCRGSLLTGKTTRKLEVSEYGLSAEFVGVPGVIGWDTCQAMEFRALQSTSVLRCAKGLETQPQPFCLV